MSQRHFAQRPVAEERLKADDKLIVITRTLYLKTETPSYYTFLPRVLERSPGISMIFETISIFGF
jgi:hypothetical protein